MHFQKTILILTLFYVIPAFSSCLDTGSHKSARDFLENNRHECLRQAQFLLQAPDLTDEKMLEQLSQPKSKKENFVNGSVIYCRFVYKKQNGHSAKFRCARTTESNQLLDSKGQLIAEAAGLVAENDEFYLTDAKKQKLYELSKNGEKKYKKALIMKVRYHDGGKRNVENYISAAASRIFWALGLPAHDNIMTSKVTCFGCTKSPFERQKSPVVDRKGRLSVNDFIDANIEIKFDAKRLYDPTETPWKWSELNQLKQNSPFETQIQIDVLALASNFIGAIGTSYMQNAIVCAKFSKQDKELCEKVIAMPHDLGAAFGSRTAKTRGDKPRGDLAHYKGSKIFIKDSCQFSFNDGGQNLPLSISKTAQEEFLKRAEVLTAENLKFIFAASHMGNLHRQPKQNASDLEDLWVQAVLDRIKEVQQARCT